MPTATFILLGAMALFIRVALGLYATGVARSKNAGGALLRNACDLCIATLAFWAVGAAILFQDANPVLGIYPGLLVGWSGELLEQTFFCIVLVLIASGIVNGVIAERSRFSSLCASALLLSVLIVPIVGNWAWMGWLRKLGFVDIGGASVLHFAGGLCAAVGAVLVGPRMGKYNRDGSSNAIPGHNVPLASLGVLLMLVAWIGYIVGCGYLQVTLGNPNPDPVVSAMNVLLAAAAGGLVSLLYGRLRYGKPEVFLTYSGMLGGLVAISAAAGMVSPLAAVGIGAIAGLLIPATTLALDLLWHIDDPSGQIAIHAMGGLWGTLAAALFLPGSFGERLRHLGIQALGLLAIAVLVLLLSIVLFALLKRAGVLRSKEADEFDGLDLAEHDINAYPDFQQTMIKSYHLREA